MEWIGKRLGNYRIEALIGTGGHARVFLARHLHLDRLAAVKILEPRPTSSLDLQERFFQEARSADALKHPHIVEIYDFGRIGESLYLVMAYGNGGSLRRVIREESEGKGPLLSLYTKIRLVSQAAEALFVAHRAGMIHRDIKPDNILLSISEEPLPEHRRITAKVTDFGLVHLQEGGVETAAGMILGTPYYMSPEQCQGEPLDARSDIYGLGMVLYELTTGRFPFSFNSPAAVIVKHVVEAPLPPSTYLPAFPRRLEEIVLRCLAKDPEARFPSAQMLHLALEACLEEIPEPRDVGALAPQRIEPGQPIVRGAGNDSSRSSDGSSVEERGETEWIAGTLPAPEDAIEAKTEVLSPAYGGEALVQTGSLASSTPSGGGGMAQGPTGASDEAEDPGAKTPRIFEENPFGGDDRNRRGDLREDGYGPIPIEPVGEASLPRHGFRIPWLWIFVGGIVLFSISFIRFFYGSPASQGSRSPEPFLIKTWQVEPLEIRPGEPVTLRWEVLGATRVLLSPFGIVAPAGLKRHYPKETTLYELTAIRDSKRLVARQEVRVKRVVPEKRKDRSSAANSRHHDARSKGSPPHPFHAESGGEPTQRGARKEAPATSLSMIEEAVSAFNRGDLDASRRIFEKAHTRFPDDPTLTNTYLDTLSEMIHFYERTGEHRKAEMLKERREKLLAAVPLSAPVVITSTPPGARILVGGGETGETTPARLRIPLGRLVAIEVVKEGYLPVTQYLRLDAGETPEPLQFELVPRGEE